MRQGLLEVCNSDAQVDRTEESSPPAAAERLTPSSPEQKHPRCLEREGPLVLNRLDTEIASFKTANGKDETATNIEVLVVRDDRDRKVLSAPLDESHLGAPLSKTSALISASSDTFGQNALAQPTELTVALEESESHIIPGRTASARKRESVALHNQAAAPVPDSTSSPNSVTNNPGELEPERSASLESVPLVNGLARSPSILHSAHQAAVLADSEPAKEKPDHGTPEPAMHAAVQAIQKLEQADDSQAFDNWLDELDAKLAAASALLDKAAEQKETMHKVEAEIAAAQKLAAERLKSEKKANPAIRTASDTNNELLLASRMFQKRRQQKRVGS